MEGATEIHPRLRQLGPLGRLAIDAGRVIGGSRRLQRSLVRWIAVGLLISGGGSVALGAATHSTPTVLLSLALGLLWWVTVTLTLCAMTPLLVTPEGRRVDLVGWPNGLSAVRAWSCVPLLLIAALPLDGTLALALWLSLGIPAGMLDTVDGWIARRFGPITAMGMAGDPAGDAVYFATAAVGCYLLGIAPLWLAVLLLVRYLAPFVATPVVLLAGRRPELVHTRWGRRNTVLTGVVLAVCAILRVVHGPVDLAALILGVPLLGTTTLLHGAELCRRLVEPRSGPPIPSEADGATAVPATGPPDR